ncbi:peptide-methionine (R)-S-oxide reductase [Pontibacter silvestris]|uniref:peptide-methionine (R)-S-oxide reductase n=1 Tax=Pontibacter silvestris TaxID=2305183 RepID=A0ABW4X317_9BACT|nr:peptide-methionine (R)-S-oxide reductase [Pontibacter silvestris]MCC9135691.1 peptide-methionine (R)-S-oxide reductase [Pontibacter silvestris]
MVRNQKIQLPKQQNPEEQHKVYACSRCGSVLFEAEKKFHVGSGFPSFWAHVGDNVQQNPLDTYGRHRVQLLCSQCKQHLGHLFEDSRTPTNVRYCINADSLKLEENNSQR